MRLRSKIAIGVVILLGLVGAGKVLMSPSKAEFLIREQAYQADAAKKRVNDVHKIAALLEEYKTKKGHYPFWERLQPSTDPNYVTVPAAVMLFQRDHVDWIEQSFPFTMSLVKYPGEYLLDTLEKGLERELSLPIDPQKAPHTFPNTYIVLFTLDGSYLVLAFLYEPQSHTSQLSQHAHTYAVSSEIGAELKPLLVNMRVTPRLFKTIPPEELRAAAIQGDAVDQQFSRWSKIRIE